MPETAPHELQTLLDELYDKHQTNSEGHLATYIPELSKVAPTSSGCA
jgi:glutaminase